MNPTKQIDIGTINLAMHNDDDTVTVIVAGGAVEVVASIYGHDGDAYCLTPSETRQLAALLLRAAEIVSGSTSDTITLPRPSAPLACVMPCGASLPPAAVADHAAGCARCQGGDDAA